MIGQDELGHARWTWITELGAPRDTAETFGYLKALEIEGLTLVDDSPAATARASKATGYDPYDTAAAFFATQRRGR